MYLPHDMQQFPCATATFKVGSQQLLAIQMANNGASTLDKDMEQLFQASEPHTMPCTCSYTCARKAFSFELWLCKGSIGTKMKKSTQEIRYGLNTLCIKVQLP